MKFTDLNPKREIGAHSLLVELGDFKILIDSGISPKDLGRASLPDYTRLATDSIDLILLTHCHLDHIGSLPCVHRNQRRARLLMTPASRDILPVMLRNSYSVMLRQRDELQVKDYPLFTKGDIEAVVSDIFPMHFGQTREFIKGQDRLRVTFYPAGHVMGAACVLIEHRGRTIFFTGDILFRQQMTLNGAHIPSMHVDTLVMETTRGCAERSDSFVHEREVEAMMAVVSSTLKNGGSCLLPVFALGRMQEMLTILHEAQRIKMIPKRFPIYCSGLGLAVVDVFEGIFRNRKNYGLTYNSPSQISIPSARPNLKYRLSPETLHTFRRRILNNLGVRMLRKDRLKPGQDIKTPSVFVMSSGMLSENTPAYQVAAALLAHEHNLIAFSGYCDPDTPGGKLQAMKPGEVFRFESLNYETPIRAKLSHFDLSGHADREHLVELAESLRPKTVILSHGEMEARQWFQKTLQEKMPATKIVNPEPQTSYDIP